MKDFFEQAESDHDNGEFNTGGQTRSLSTPVKLKKIRPNGNAFFQVIVRALF